MKKTAKRWTAKDERSLKSLVAKKKSISEIADIMDRTESSIQSKMSHLGIKSNRLRGTYSKILDGKSKGGAIMVRVPGGIHKRFLQLCHSQGKSMNKYLIDQIFNAINSGA